MYRVTSNRESGFGRYDVMLEPCKKEDPAFFSICAKLREVCGKYNHCIQAIWDNAGKYVKCAKE